MLVMAGADDCIRSGRRKGAQMSAMEPKLRVCTRANLRSVSLPYLLLLPQMILVGLFSLYPLLEGAVISFQDWTMEGRRWVGLANYHRMVQDPVFWVALWNTILYAAGAVPLMIVAGLLLALAVDEPLRGRMAFRALFLIPYLLSWVVVALDWQWIYSAHYGLLNWLLEGLGLRPYRWLQDPRFTLVGIIITTAWTSAGFYMVIFLAGLQSIPLEYYEAAQIDGASTWVRFRYITLPLLRPIALFVAVFAVIISLRVFDLIWVMTGGGPGRASMVMVMYIYERAFEGFQLGYASALSIFLFLVILGLTIVQLRVFSPREAE